MLGALSQRPEGSPTLFLHLGEDGAWEIGQSWAAVVGYDAAAASHVHVGEPLNLLAGGHGASSLAVMRLCAS